MAPSNSTAKAPATISSPVSVPPVGGPSKHSPSPAPTPPPLTVRSCSPAPSVPSPLRPRAILRLQVGSRSANPVFVGSDLATPGSSEIFFSVPKLLGRFTSDPFRGRWKFAGIEFPAGSINQARIATFDFNADSGLAGTVTISSRSHLDAGRPSTSSYPNATYLASLDASGRLTLPGNGPFNGTFSFQLDASAAVALLGSNANGRHAIWIGVRYGFPDDDAARSQLNGQYRLAGIRLSQPALSLFAGSLRAAPPAPIVFSLRNVSNGTVLDSFLAAQTPSGQFLHSSNFFGNAFASHNATADPATPREFSFGVAIPTLSGTGTFCSPFGILNAASFAPSGAALAPSSAVAATVPFPTTLAGVRVEINGRPAPIYAVSPTQISTLIPLNTTGSAASFTVINGTQRCSEVTVPLAPTSPGLFTIPPAGTGPAALLHADYTLVSASSPARRGETVQLFLTGLGAVTPAVDIAAIAPANPLSLVNANVQVRIGNKMGPGAPDPIFMWLVFNTVRNVPQAPFAPQ